ncbi:PucR family transcriptional regulator [Nocardia yamanashiensis]|uniref:PucR family transcriptional regulator n=1 Tax=Nocardia yamanashiensis TaxID=209247 RepID=UPI00082DB6D4|nr:helix-turn-helix domain-containing protein [Nocardia yamanashiensis]
MDATPGVADPAIQQIIGELIGSVDALAGTLTDRIVDVELPYLADNAENRRRLYDSGHANLTAILQHLNGSRPLRLESARAGSRTASADFVEFTTESWAIVDRMSDAIATAYRETEHRLVHADAEAHARLVRDLFDARPESPGRTLETLRALRLPEQARFAVLAAETGDPGAAPGTEAARLLRRHHIPSVWDIHTGTHLGLICAPPTSDLDTHLTAVASLFPARVGVSRLFTEPTALPAALTEARLALLCSPPGQPAMVRYDSAPLPLLLIHLPDAARTAAADIFGPLLALPDAARTELLTTLQTWFACDGSTTATARMLHCHRNTILYRLHKIRDLTGRDCDNPAQAAELYLALQTELLLGAREPAPGTSE